KVQKDFVKVIAIFDGWKNIKHKHFFGIVLITSEGDALIWKAYDISSKHSKTENVIAYIKKIINDAEENGIKINCFVSDSAEEYAAARKHKIKQAEFHQNDAKKRHIAGPINNESSSLSQDIDRNNIQIIEENSSEQELNLELDNSNTIIENKAQWERLVTN
ncbi:8838_t:CDS:2, partial [Cetraspora pellucida]